MLPLSKYRLNCKYYIKVMSKQVQFLIVIQDLIPISLLLLIVWSEAFQHNANYYYTS
jgi:hypothetical protein